MTPKENNAKIVSDALKEASETMYKLQSLREETAYSMSVKEDKESYAKQQAVAFFNHMWGQVWDAGIMWNKYNDDKKYTTEELYDLFINSPK